MHIKAGVADGARSSRTRVECKFAKPLAEVKRIWNKHEKPTVSIVFVLLPIVLCRANIAFGLLYPLSKWEVLVESFSAGVPDNVGICVMAHRNTRISFSLVI